MSSIKPKLATPLMPVCSGICDSRGRPRVAGLTGEYVPDLLPALRLHAQQCINHPRFPQHPDRGWFRAPAVQETRPIAQVEKETGCAIRPCSPGRLVPGRGPLERDRSCRPTGPLVRIERKRGPASRKGAGPTCSRPWRVGVTRSPPLPPCRRPGPLPSGRLPPEIRHPLRRHPSRVPPPVPKCTSPHRLRSDFRVG